VGQFSVSGNSTAMMAEWAKENRTEFYRLYARLIPVEGDVTMTVNNSLVAILSGMPRSDYVPALETKTKPLLLEGTAMDAKEVADAKQIAVLNKAKR
jgi:hypothetical protein